MKAEGVLPREWPVEKLRNVLFLQFSKRKPVYEVGHGRQRPASACPSGRFVSLERDSSLRDHRLRQLHSGAGQSGVNVKQGRRQALHTTPAHHEMVTGNPERNSDSLVRLYRKLLLTSHVLSAQHEFTVTEVERRKKVVEQCSP
jgi:hypothetical protein